MATVKRCDRCSKTFALNEKDSLILKITFANGHVRNSDLCPYCAHRFEDFMYNQKVTREKDPGPLY